jgi:hypothetical protein
MFLPMMACRLMLSLKKAASEPKGLWTLTNRPENEGGIFTNATLQFVAGRPLDVSGEISDTLSPRGGEDVELEEVSQSPRSSGQL